MSFNANLTNCDTEPIHIPGKIQSHGFLVAVNKDHIVIFCSENIWRFLFLTAADLLNRPLGLLEIYLETANPEGFHSQLLVLGTANKTFESFNPYAIDIKGHACNLIISVSGDQ